MAVYSSSDSAPLRLLVVEDNQALVTSLFLYFEARGWQLDAAPDGLIGLHLAQNQSYDAIVLDWMLPRMEGKQVLEQMRRQGVDTPVMMLTARDQLSDKLDGFRAGTDDYLTKPFDLSELEMRLMALVVRSQGRVTNRDLVIGDLRFDLATLEVFRGARRLHLFPASRKLLRVLMTASPVAVSRQQLEYALWGDEPPDGDMLRSHIYELRRSVDGDESIKLIQTLPRVGYRIMVPDELDTP